MELFKKEANKMDNMIDAMMAWESGTLDNWSEIKLFQHLIDTGEAWQLQGFYGRHATELLQEGICHAAAEIPDPDF
jgi:hypothetical protein